LKNALVESRGIEQKEVHDEYKFSRKTSPEECASTIFEINGTKVDLDIATDIKKISQRTKEAVRQYLIKEGAIEKAMISATAYDQFRHFAPNKTKEGKDNPEGKAENRRAEILIYSE
jgi:hypothetical protein